jgi:hypothetical protein
MDRFLWMMDFVKCCNTGDKMYLIGFGYIGQPGVYMTIRHDYQ